MLYLDAESSEWRSRAPSWCADGAVPSWSPSSRVLAAAAAVHRSGSAAAASDFCAAVFGEPGASWPAPDARVVAAQRFIATRLDRSLRLAEIAREVHLSPSRLTHVFREGTGVPVRRYIQWCRLRAAVDAALRGRSLTEAAHEAGFADAAHLSRTFRAMFGISPSAFTQDADVVTMD